MMQHNPSRVAFKLASGVQRMEVEATGMCQALGDIHLQGTPPNSEGKQDRVAHIPVM